VLKTVHFSLDNAGMGSAWEPESFMVEPLAQPEKARAPET
jgi:hypothetical protein